MSDWVDLNKNNDNSSPVSHEKIIKKEDQVSFKNLEQNTQTKRSKESLKIRSNIWKTPQTFMTQLRMMCKNQTESQKSPD